MGEDGATTTQKPAASSFELFVVRVLSFVALGISAYLAYLALTGQTAAGCGAGAGLDCDLVLSSRWSYWTVVPVSVLAASLWLTVLVVSLFAGETMPARLRSAAQFLLAFLLSAAAGTALWFIGLQAIELHHWCLYCMLAHSCALAAWGIWMARGGGTFSSRFSGAAAGLMLAILVPAGQLHVPPPPRYALHYVEDQPGENPLVVDGLGDAPPRYMSVLGGGAKIDVANLPLLGSAEAEHTVVLLADYACPHCRLLHADLLAAQHEYEGKLALVLLPTPLSHKCNELVEEGSSTSPDACDLARLALAVWKVKPSAFAEFDAWLFEPAKPRTFVEARKKAAELIGEEALAAAESDPSLPRQLQRHVDLYASSPAELLPQIMGSNAVLSEGVDSLAELLDALEHKFSLER